MPYAYTEDDWTQTTGQDDGWEDERPGIHTFPPGEEAALQSHAGGEAIMHQIMEGIRPGTRSFRVQKQVDLWQAQLPLLVDTYLQFRDAETEVAVGEDVGHEAGVGEWPLTCLGFDEHGSRLFSHAPDAVRVNQTLLRHGYIGGAPQKPSIAFSLRMLEIYRQIHRVCPRFTLDTLAKTLNHLHKVPRKSYLAEQLSTAYDAYLAIQWEVDKRVQAALGRDETWEWKHVCPPCFYKVHDELPLKLSWLGSLDGNNSLKLVDSTFRAGHPRFDNRTSTSFRWLTPAEVNKYQDEVKLAPKVRENHHMN
ncbi:hypothetical protein B0H12DRAFT_1015347 [Mycena haematopus]|nr:hypothetical protein B0H12DRAFT_1015347 [Mycena haematopus]